MFVILSQEPVQSKDKGQLISEQIHAVLNFPKMQRNIAMISAQGEWLACRKSRDPTLNAVLLFSKTVC